MAVAISENTDGRRYEITVDGQLAGVADYRREGDLIDFTHTETFAPYSGRGLGAALVVRALDDARDRGLRVRPSCWFVRDIIARYPDEYLPMVDETERADYGL